MIILFTIFPSNLKTPQKFMHFILFQYNSPLRKLPIAHGEYFSNDFSSHIDR